MKTLPPFVWHLCFALLVACCLLPTVALLYAALSTEDGRATIYSQSPALLVGHVRQTLMLAGLVVPLALVLGWVAAWAVTRCEFPGRRWFSILLCLPFAIPSHVLAGTWLRASYHPSIPSPENLWGAAVVMVLTLYPWAYLPAKMFFAGASSQYEELARSLRLTWWQRLWRVHLGLASPVLIASGLLLFMAVIGDYGTAHLLGIKTLSVGIQDAQAGMMRGDWAAQIALVGLALPLLAVVVLELSGARRAAYNPSNRSQPVARRSCSLFGQAVIMVGLFGLLSAALLIPVGFLASWAIQFLDRLSLSDLPGQVLDTLMLTLTTTAITVSIALLVILLLRRRAELAMWRHLTPVLILNFAIPGIMIGIGLLSISTEGILSNSPLLLIFGCCIAVLCFPVLSLQAGSASIGRDVDDLCATLALRGRQRLWRIDLPLLRPALAVGCLLVAVTVIKELPISQVLQPFGFRSLSLRVYNFTGVGSYQVGALHALSLIALSVYPVIALDRLLMAGREPHDYENGRQGGDQR